MNIFLKRMVTVSIGIVIVVGSLGNTSFAASTSDYSALNTGANSGITGECTWNYSADGVLTISGKGAMADCEFKISDTPWVSFSDDIKKVIIDNGVTSIGRMAFIRCKNLQSVSIPNSVKRIGPYAFDECTNLKKISVPSSVVEIGAWAFDNTSWYNNQSDGIVYAGNVAYRYKGDCPQNLKLEDDTVGIAETAFQSNKKLQTISLPNGLKYIGWNAFAYCSNLDNVIVPDTVTEFGSGGAFTGCSSLKTIKLPNHLTTIGGFSDCESLEEIEIPEMVENIETHAFSFCPNLKEIHIPNKVISIGYNAFAYCENLQKVTIPNSVKTIDTEAFENCTSLKNISIPDSVTSIGSSAFSNTAWLDNQPDGIVYAGKIAYDFKNEDICPEIVELKAGTIGVSDFAFYGCKNMKKIVIPWSVKQIGVEACGYFFNSSWQTEKINNFTIEGYVDTTAEKYANENDFRFIARQAVIGDSDGDGKVEAKDRAYLTRHLAKWTGYETINTATADVNQDNQVNTKDRMILSRHLANWKGYETLPIN